MTYRKLVTPAILSIFLLGAARGRAQTNGTGQAAAAAPLSAPAQKILTKDAEYMRLLIPPAGNDFLQTYSKGYQEKSEEIEARIAGISDENLRSRARGDEWSRVLKKDRDRFRTEAEISFNEARTLFLQTHRDGLFEVGRATYDESNHSLAVQASPAAPIEANFRVAMSSAKINQVYDKFHQMAAPEIEKKAHEYVSRAGVGSNCSRNPDWCYQYAKEDIERSLRSARLVVVAHGDMQDKKIDRLLLVDYDTETEILELDPHISALNTAAWRFSIGLLPTVSTEPESSDSQAPPGGAAPAETRSAPEEQMQHNKSGNAVEPAPNPAPSPIVPPTRLRVPSQVTAASIVVQTKPQYPPQARTNHVQGDVVLHAIIDKAGKVSEVQVLSGDDLLAPSALEAVRQWRYKPMLLDGEPAEVDTTITVTFSLNE